MSGRKIGEGCVDEANRLGANLRRARLEMNVSQEELARDAGVVKSTISKAECCGMMSLPNLGRIALALGRTPQRLLHGVTAAELIDAEGTK